MIGSMSLTRPYDAMRRGYRRDRPIEGTECDCFFICQYNDWLARHGHLPYAVGLNMIDRIGLYRLWPWCTFANNSGRRIHRRTRMRQGRGEWRENREPGIACEIPTPRGAGCDRSHYAVEQHTIDRAVPY
jgi:hypothetical protein